MNATIVIQFNGTQAELDQVVNKLMADNDKEATIRGIRVDSHPESLVIMRTEVGLQKAKDIQKEL